VRIEERSHALPSTFSRRSSSSQRRRPRRCWPRLSTLRCRRPVASLERPSALARAASSWRGAPLSTARRGAGSGSAYVNTRATALAATAARTIQARNARYASQARGGRQARQVSLPGALALALTTASVCKRDRVVVAAARSGRRRRRLQRARRMCQHQRLVLQRAQRIPARSLSLQLPAVRVRRPASGECELRITIG